MKFDSYWTGGWSLGQVQCYQLPQVGRGGLSAGDCKTSESGYTGFHQKKIGKPDAQISKRKLESFKEDPFQSPEIDTITSQSLRFTDEVFQERSGGKSSTPMNRLIEKLDPSIHQTSKAAIAGPGPGK